MAKTRKERIDDIKINLEPNLLKVESKGLFTHLGVFLGKRAAQSKNLIADTQRAFNEGLHS